jgi:glycosyltransferase involved in cell wall biosynthesis
MLNVCIVSTYPTKGDGVSKYTSELCRSLKQQDVFIQTKKVYYLQNKLSSIKWIFLLFCKFDIVHVQYTPTGSGPGILLYLFFKRKSTQCILTSHETPSTYSKHLKGFLKDIYVLFERAVCNKADVVTVHTRQHLNELVSLRIPTRKIKMLHHPIIAPHHAYHIERDRKCGVFFGRISPKKGVENLLSALSYCSSAIKIDFIGPPARGQEAYYKSLIELAHAKALAHRVRFRGYLDDAEVTHALVAAGFSVFPYLYVTQSGALLTAMGHGLPYIASELPAFVEIYKDFGGGLIIPQGDSEKLAEAITALSTNERVYAEKARQLERARNEMSWEQFACNLKGLYEGKE